MGLKVPFACHNHRVDEAASSVLPPSSMLSRVSSSAVAAVSYHPSCTHILQLGKHRSFIKLRNKSRSREKQWRNITSCPSIVIEASNKVAASTPFWDSWKPDQKGTPSVSLSDVIWPSAGAFAAMAILGRIDKFLAPKGLSMTIAPLGAVCAVLFASPSSPAARKYNMFMAQIGCAAIGVLAFYFLGPGWFAKSSALAASIAFMVYTRSTHPPAASLPLLFIDGAKFHSLHLWYALFPGAAGCVLLCLIQEVVNYLKDNFKF